jgi:hypothetical protein
MSILPFYLEVICAPSELTGPHGSLRPLARCARPVPTRRPGVTGGGKSAAQVSRDRSPGLHASNFAPILRFAAGPRRGSSGHGPLSLEPFKLDP